MNKREPSYLPAGRDRLGLAARKTAAAILERVIAHGDSLDDLCSESGGMANWRALIAKDRSLVRAIVTTALRHRGRIECSLGRVLDRKLPHRAEHLSATLHVAAAQILFLEIPDSAAVNLAVTSLREDRRSARFASLGNAVLRRLSTEKEAILENCGDWRLAFPPWIAKRIRGDFGREKAERIAHSFQAGAPVDLTLSPHVTGERRVELIASLEAVELPTGSLRILHPTPVRQLAGYDEGCWWVQDAAAALPARMLGDVDGLSVADLCAAPGGKTAQLAAAGARVTAIDRSARRLEILRENLDRLNLEAELLEADIEEWQPSRKFDAVLLDAPCSATGIIRRHPDIAWIKTAAQVDDLAAMQKRLLRKAVVMTRAGGLVVYANCSILKQEGEDIAAEMAAGGSGVEIDPLRAGEIPGIDHLINGQGALRTLPDDEFSPATQGSMDGFFAIRFRVPQ